MLVIRIKKYGEMLNEETDRRKSCSLLELSHSNIRQLQFANEQKQTNKQTNMYILIKH